MKQKLQILLAMVLFTIAFPILSNAYDFEIAGINYTIVSLANKTCAVTANKDDNCYKGDIVIPNTVSYNNQEVTVVGINQSAFYSCKELTSITLPETIEWIGEQSEGSSATGAFEYCEALQTFIIPSSCTLIGDRAFYGCRSLTSIKFPNSVSSIGKLAFALSDLKSLILPNIENIGEFAFSNCSHLTSVEITGKIQKIKKGVFRDCSSLKEILLPSEIESIYTYAFYNCTQLQSIILPDSLNYLGAYAFGKCSSLISLDLPKKTREVGSNFITENNLITSLTFGDVKFIGVGTGGYDNSRIYSYEGCEQLKELRFEKPKYGSDYIERTAFDPETKTESYSGCGWGEYFDNIETLYVNRKLSITYAPKLEKLVLGSSVGYVPWNNPQLWGNLKTIVSYALYPPVITYDKEPFSTEQYLNITLMVPNEAIEAYKKNADWNSFWNIEGFDPEEAGIHNNDSVYNTTIRHENSRYNLQGQPVSEDYKGVVIVRLSDGSSKKIMQ